MNITIAAGELPGSPTDWCSKTRAPPSECHDIMTLQCTVTRKQWDKIVLSKLTSTHTAFSLANIVSFLFWSQQWTWRHRLSGKMITARLCNCPVDKMSSVLMTYWEKYLRDWRKYIWGTRRNALLHLEEIQLEFNYCHSKYVYTFRPIAK